MKRIINHCRHAIMMTLLATLLLGVVIPLIFTAISQLLFPNAANGSLVVHNGKPIGSELIGQEFTRDRYFWGRLSATTPPYNPAASSASHLSMNNPTLLINANERMARLPVGKKIPLALITSSGSGLDPHISPLAAYYQAERVAKARGKSVASIQHLIATHVNGPVLGFIGTPTVNLLALNMSLDAMP